MVLGFFQKKSSKWRLHLIVYVSLFFAGCLGERPSTYRSPSSSSSSSEATSLLVAPGSPTVSGVSSSSASLSWSDSSVGELGFDLERCQGGSCSLFTPILSTYLPSNSSSYVDTSLSRSQTYRYRIRTRSTTGEVSSWSYSSYFTSLSDIYTPLSFYASTIAVTSVTLSWAAVTGASVYDLDFCTGAGCTSFSSVLTDTVLTSTSVTGLTASSTYRFRLRSQDASGHVSDYRYLTVRTYSAPGAPSSLTADNCCATAVNLEWTDSSSYETGYRIYYCSGVACTPTLQVTTAANITTYTVTGLTASTSYSFYVRPIVGSDLGSASSTTTVVTQATLVDVSALTLSSRTGTGLTFSWTNTNSGVTGYVIKRCSGSGCTPTTQIDTASLFSYTDSNLTEDTYYVYCVAAYRDLTNDLGNCVSSTDFMPNVKKPRRFISNVYNNSGTLTVTLHWEHEDSSTKNYQLQRCRGYGCNDFRDLSTGINAVTYSDAPTDSINSLGKDSVLGTYVYYSYRVRQVDASGGESSWQTISNLRLPALESAPVTNGIVYTQFLQGNTLYLGGSFTRSGFKTGSAGLIAGGSDELSETWYQYASSFLGTANAVASDGSGGYFVAYTSGGSYVIKRILSTGTIESVATADSTVKSLVYDSVLSYLYVGGDFTTLAGSTRNGLGRMAYSGGVWSLNGWDPSLTAGNKVYAILYDAIPSGLSTTDPVVYVGGSFSTMGANGLSQEGLSIIRTVVNGGSNQDDALDNLTLLSVAAGGKVYALQKTNGALYVGGQFTANASYNNLLRFSFSTLAVDSLFQPEPNNIVRALGSTPTHLIVGGDFTNIASTARGYAAALLLSDASLASWNPSFNAKVLTLMVGSSSIYAGGLFTSASGSSRNYLASYDRSDFSLDSWDPDANGQIQSLCIYNNDVLVGGAINSVGLQRASYLASAELVDKTISDLGLTLDGTVRSFFYYDDRIYLGGEFTTANDLVRSRFLEYSLADSELTDLVTSFDDTVYSVVRKGSKIFVGGSFTTVNTQFARPSASTARYGFAALNATDGSELSSSSFTWEVNQTSSTIYALAYDATYLYVGGGFTSTQTSSRTNFAKVALSSGALQAYDPSPDGAVYALQLDSTWTNGYVGGAFDNYSSSGRQRAAKFALATGVLDAFSATITGGSVYSILPVSTQVYLGGTFTTVGGVGQPYAAAVDSTGALDVTYIPAIDAQVRSQVYQGALAYLGIYLGGAFTTANTISLKSSVGVTSVGGNL